MKKIVLAGLFAVCALALSQQQASAWVNSRFGVGLNWESQSGGNSLLWGAWRNGQPPGPEGFSSNFGASQGRSPFFGSAPDPQYAPVPQGSFEPPMAQQPYAIQQASPYQFATYPRQTYYYYPAPAYYYYSR